MHSETTNGAVLAKTRELCQTIVDQTEFLGLRRNVDTFMEDEAAQQLYRDVAEKGEILHQKQRQGDALAESEIADYEQCRQALLGNPVARQFLDAQEQMQSIHQTVSRYVMKTLEIGRVASAEDFETCGQGCSCGH